MNFRLTTEQTSLVESVRRYCSSAYSSEKVDAHCSDTTAVESPHWTAFAKMGLMGVVFSEDVGGSAQSVVELALILQEFGRAMVTEPFIACAVLAGLTIDRAATNEQRRSLLVPMIQGQAILALAHSEREAGGNVERISTLASATNSGIQISGSKWLALGCPDADIFLVSARMNERHIGVNDIRLFVVARDTPGLERRAFVTLDGRSGVELKLNNVVVPFDALLDGEASSLSALEWANQHGIVAVCSEAIGAMERLVEVTADYLKVRKAYDVTLSSFQALQHRLADMVTELELSRSIVYRAICSLTNKNKNSSAQAVSAAKAFVGQSARFIASNAVQLHGAIGFSDEYTVSRYFKKLNAIELQFGTSSFHIGRIAADVGSKITTSQSIEQQAVPMD